ncbi:tetratricopeptide repeat protein, partial [Klebsiella variicola]|uniref:tetratricopeptide repeat protein n=1 Tax=Klebsiella variicola TaxID=244366 RepID=UPI00273194F4
ADRLQRSPDDADGWALLARAYEQLGRPQDALPAYAQLERLRPDDAQVWSQHAVTLAMVKGEGLAGEPEALLQRALAVDPRH